ncbi:unnamed protein product [Penicillium roqueforti FM164]|uniref:Str. FM013 n=2 Tax=Penicillium TaxID=5073 RepID=A0A0G4PZC6_PENC3|nr:unnamed protein product [Penicillium roqueforti FM164]CRL31515.1 unnamed protein product [Penicillium camemberti]
MAWIASPSNVTREDFQIGNSGGADEIRRVDVCALSCFSKTARSAGVQCCVRRSARSADSSFFRRSLSLRGWSGRGLLAVLSRRG